MSDAETTVLYALSTLAQTCAALAAFVGAVGIYRLQLLRGGRDTIERNVRGLAAQTSLVGADVAALVPFEVVVDRVTNADPSQGDVRIRAAAREALAAWSACSDPIQQSRNALIAFEAWNLLVIGVSLVGFGYVHPLALSPCPFLGLWTAAVGTVAVTGYCVYAWTR
jgi:hypothetical protein